MTQTPTRLIGLNGRLHSGKDSACDAIVEIASPSRVQRAAFADKLKMSACAALGIPFTDAADAVRICNMLKEKASINVFTWADEGVIGMDHVLTGREYLQWYGTESHRDIFGTDFWVDALLPKPSKHWERYEPYNQPYLNQAFPDADVVVITDVRFPNEAERILDLGGEVWCIDAEERLGPLPEDAHVSERPLPPEYITHIVSNNHTLETFQNVLRKAYHARRVDRHA